MVSFGRDGALIVVGCLLTGEGATVPMRLAGFLALLCALAGGKLSEGFLSTPGGAASRRSVQAHHQRGLGRHAELCIMRSTAEPQEGGPESLMKATDEGEKLVWFSNQPWLVLLSAMSRRTLTLQSMT